MQLTLNELSNAKWLQKYKETWTKGKNRRKKDIEKSLSQHGHLALGEVFNYLFTP